MPSPKAGNESRVLEAALRRLARAGGTPASDPLPTRAREPRLPAPPPRASARREPVLTLEPPRLDDPGALAALLADEVGQKLDQLLYLWSVIQDLEPFAAPGEKSLRARAAELFLCANGGPVDLPLEGPLRAVRSFLDAHDMDEPYVRKLCAWYLRDDPRPLGLRRAGPRG